MAYADYEQYAIYGNGIISETEWPKYSKYASSLIDLNTFGRVPTLTSVPTEVVECCCELAEIFFKESKTEDSISVGFASEKVGEYSVSYKGTAEIEKAFDAKKSKCLRHYLLDSGLLYRG